jgi:serine protease Do
VIINSGGYIITNEHVIHEASKIMVNLPGEKTGFEGTLISSVPEKDLALIKIDVKKLLTPIEMGDSDSLMIGETAIALGNPFGLENTVTTGVISAKNRSVSSGGRVVFSGLLQTDAAINPGNSGGALLDINGRLIGINTAIKQGAEGIGFAIPVNEVKKILKELVSVEKISDLWLGIKVEDTETGGVQVSAVQKKSPAEKAGIKKGNTITEVNRKKIGNCFEFHRQLIDTTKKSTDITLKVGKKAVKVSLVKYGETMLTSRCGFKGKTLTLWMARRLKMTRAVKGVLITDVYNDSPAKEVGLEVGDVIVSIKDQRVSDIQEIISILESTKEKETIEIVVLRGNKVMKGKMEVK